MWTSATVVGCGLIGASFALALRRSGTCSLIAGWDSSPKTLGEALERGIIDEVDGSFARGEISRADLVYLAMPVGQIIAFLKDHGAQIKRGAVVTDSGSTKVDVCRAAREHILESTQFIGGHPIAGSHHTGLAHARADLFDDQPYVLVPEEACEGTGAVLALEETIVGFGARVSRMTAADHDHALAFISHLPQLVSSALAATVHERPNAGTLLHLAGGGYRDMTRLAGSSWSVWADIFATNTEYIVSALDTFIEKLTAAREEMQAHAGREGDDLPAVAALFGASRDLSTPEGP